MRPRPTVADVGRNFTDYIDRVIHRGECFVLVEGSKAVAELRPVTPVRTLRELPALLESLPHLTVEEVDSFAADLAAARAELESHSARDPWES